MVKKMNYQKELEKLIVKLEKESAETFAAQLLCTMQQLCFRVFEQLF